MKKKLIALGILSLSLMFESAQADAMRYFMQGDRVGSETPYGNNVAIGNYIDVGDAKLYYEVYGAGKPIFIFHGGGVGCAYELGNIIDDLRTNYQVIVVATRGHGRSEIGSEPLSYEQKANDMASVMKSLTNTPAQIIGFSDGAYTAYKVATMYPELVERIVAIGAGTLKKGYFSGAMNVEDFKKIDPQFMDIELQIRPESNRMQEFYDQYMKFWNGMKVGREIFSNIKCPVLLMCGDEDDHAPVVTVLEAHQMIPNSRLCVIPKAWHGCFNDNYEVARPAILEFVNAKIDELKPSAKVEYNSKRIK